ncbi:hypothetical protein PAE9249_03627 [Paenibacillus sp. CECT 9249]|uniref:hypothetical protein n=1 Tax=Paenibacillus sp. CECT 9249 TaxID=2845385 RepID=UPI001E4E47D1|nr:hypothetical protein [Paenibacillus sp. CECT 9249]CAH0121101.1 hypothetical protein PAE9249_03627 [Paenibacillus sp. CECT 9249]
MLYKPGRIGIMITMVWMLGGCGIPATPIDMIKPPLSVNSLERDRISDELIQLLPAQAKLVVPVQGKERQDISFGDMDGDGIDEAVIVYEENNPSGKVLKAALFKRDNNKWRIVSEVKGFGYGLEYAGFSDFNDDGLPELALAWSLGAAGNGLDVYGLNHDQLELIKKKEYHGKLDLDEE